MNNAYDGWERKPDVWEKEPDDLKNIMHQYKSIYSDVDLTLYNKVNIDAIFVLAGGLRDNGEVHGWVMRRLDLTYHIYKNFDNKKKPKIICLGGGTYHKPPIVNDDKYVVHESTACAEYLINLGIEPQNIYKEWASFDTIANGYFSYVNFVLPMELKNILIITSEFHMARTKEIFRWILNIANSNCKLNFVSASDKNLHKCIIDRRVEREEESLKNLKNKVFPRIKTMKEFHRWFYEDHKAYCSHNQLIRENYVDSIEKKSY